MTTFETVLPAPRAGDRVGGKYEILGVLGQGGFGVVYEARNLNLGSLVAIKVAHRLELDARLWRESKAAARLESPHAVRVLDVDRDAQGRSFMVMERLHGRTLRDILKERRALSPALAQLWSVQICEALEEAHDQGLIHRDIKPSNLFVAEDGDGASCIKLLDFGLARALESTVEETLTDSRGIVGSPSYMSPEQIRSVRLSPRSDLWSVGVVLYEMLTGRRPFEAESTAGVLASVVADPPVSLLERDASLPVELVSTVEHCLRKAERERIQSAAELRVALLALELGDAPLSRSVRRKTPSALLEEDTRTTTVPQPASVESTVRLSPVATASVRRLWSLAFVTLLLGLSAVAVGSLQTEPSNFVAPASPLPAAPAPSSSWVHEESPEPTQDTGVAPEPEEPARPPQSREVSEKRPAAPLEKTSGRRGLFLEPDF